MSFQITLDKWFHYDTVFWVQQESRRLHCSWQHCSTRSMRRADGASPISCSCFKKICLINYPLIGDISDIKLIRTDTTLDLSQKAEKRWRQIVCCSLLWLEPMSHVMVRPISLPKEKAAIRDLSFKPSLRYSTESSQNFCRYRWWVHDSCASLRYFLFHHGANHRWVEVLVIPDFFNQLLFDLINSHVRVQQQCGFFWGNSGVEACWAKRQK